MAEKKTKEKKASEKEQPKKKASEKEQPKKKAEGSGEELVELVRLSGVVVDGRLTLEKALMKIKGLGPRVAESIIPGLGHPRDMKVGLLDDKQIEEIEEKLENIDKTLPTWMLNRRKDLETGEDRHHIGPDLDMVRRNDVNLEKKMKSYRGVRHALNLPVRGQRTRSSFRKGSSIGVKRKKG
ncbi:MAG: 30S ribosomal protein S13 [Candidatus Altiarchaeales archaeon]|nr:30S ribosomal protein S13 [Candidatus Altiarchaeales archaeon]MBD3415682.1 30S ribosomal protein S13 [Candidatus Altiarchaeales archaeon]